LEGIFHKACVFGDKMLLSEFQLEKGRILPRHAHPQEQIGRLIAGKIRLHIAGQAQIMEPGDCWCIPANIEHGADILEDSIAIEVFAPVREDYLPK